MILEAAFRPADCWKGETMHRSIISIGTVAACLALIQVQAIGSQIAYDSAGDSVYNGYGQFNPLPYQQLNGGYGWGGAWQPAGFGNGMFVRSSSLNGSGDPQGTGDINSPRTPSGRAWGILAPAQIQTGRHDVARPFSGALAPGQTFMIDFDPGGISRSTIGVYNMALGPPGGFGGIAVNVRPSDSPDFRVGNYDGNFLTTAFDTGVPLTDRGVHIAFTLLSATEGRFDLTSFAPGSPSGSVVIPYTVPLTAVTLQNDSTNGPFGFTDDLQQHRDHAGTCSKCGSDPVHITPVVFATTSVRSLILHLGISA